MHMHDIAVASGYLGAALGVAMVVPQILRTVRERGVPGVSALSWALTAVSCTAWLLYGVRTGEMPQIPGNVLLVSGAVAVVLLVPSAVGVRTRGFRLAGAGLVIAMLAAVAPAAGLGAVAIAIGLVSGLPQTAASLRGRRSGGGSAVSLLTWSIRVACQASWLFYAVMVHDLTVTVSAIVLLSNAVAIVLLESTRRPVPVTPVPATI